MRSDEVSRTMSHALPIGLVVMAMAALFATFLLVPSQAYASDMYRMYNPNTGEHFYTATASERNDLYVAGWDYEGIGWVAPDSGQPVYRLYNPNAGDHHYTKSSSERDNLERAGWKYEGVGWRSGGSKAVYRQYNPNARTGAHNFTTSKSENDDLVRIGWKGEGISWYGTKAGRLDAIPDSVKARRDKATSSSSSATNSASTVYVTPSGKAFHRKTCPTLANSKTVNSMTRAQAERSGRTACKVCKP